MDDTPAPDVLRPRRARPVAVPRGSGDDVTTTATAVLALSHRPEFANLTGGALKWLAARKDPSGTWGSTQPTVLALKALLAGSGAPVRRDAEATIAIRPAGEGSEGGLGKIVIPAAQSDIVHAIRVPAAFGAGNLRLELDSKQAAGMGYQLALRYHSRAQAAPAQSPLAMEVHYDRTQLTVNQSVAVEAGVKNRTGQEARMLLADIGTPPGFAVDPTGLEKLRTDGKIERYTLTARGVIVYINTIAAGNELRIKYAMIAKMPLKAVAAPTKVYAYYDPSQQAAVPAVTFTVK